MTKDEYLLSVTPLNEAEITTVLTETQHGPLPKATMSRVFATLHEHATLTARVRELEAEVQRLEVNGIHSCWDECPRIACVQARHIRELETRLAAQGEELVKLREAAQDALDGWRYIRMYHGDLYGVGWDRVENSLRAALGDG